MQMSAQDTNTKKQITTRAVPWWIYDILRVLDVQIYTVI